MDKCVATLQGSCGAGTKARREGRHKACPYRSFRGKVERKV